MSLIPKLIIVTGIEASGKSFIASRLSEELNLPFFSKDIIKEKIWPFADEVGRGDILWPMRYALSGQEKSPDPFQLAEIFGKKETLARISLAVEKLKML